jgi:hypothetical protein
MQLDIHWLQLQVGCVAAELTNSVDITWPRAGVHKFSKKIGVPLVNCRCQKCDTTITMLRTHNSVVTCESHCY